MGTEFKKNGDEREYEVEVIIVDPTRQGIIKALNRHGGHNDNG